MEEEKKIIENIDLNKEEQTHSKTLEIRTVEDVMEDSFLKYSMSVIISRAIPDLIDAALRKAGSSSDNVTAVAMEWEMEGAERFLTDESPDDTEGAPDSKPAISPERSETGG